MFGIPFAWKIGAAAAIVIGVGGYIGWLKWDIAAHKATIAEQQTAMVRLAGERDQEKATAEGWRSTSADFEKRLAEEAASRDRERKAQRAAISDRDKIIDEVRRAKTARDPSPDAWRPAYRRVQRP